MVKQILIAIDQLANSIFGGYADETLSARVYRHRRTSAWWAFWYRAINLLFFWQADHCMGSYNAEFMRKHLPKAYRNG